MLTNQQANAMRAFQRIAVDSFILNGNLLSIFLRILQMFMQRE